MKVSYWNRFCPTLFGTGAVELVGEKVKELGVKKVMVVTENDLIRFNVATKVIDNLKAAGFDPVIFDKCKADAPSNICNDGAKLAYESGIDGIVAVGGGSSLDTAKAIGIIVSMGGTRIEDYYTTSCKERKLKLVCISTTAGTGSENSQYAVIGDEKTGVKMVPEYSPDLALVDPVMTYTLPKSQTAATGMDALTHAIEGYITKGAWVMSDMYELQAIKMIAENLPIAVEEPTNPVGREGMALAQYIAAQAFSNVGLGLVHGMAHPMGSLHDIPHGVANALLLPTIMEFNMPKCIEKFGVIAKTMGVNTDGMTAEQAAQAAVDAVKALSIRVGIPQTLTELGIKESDIPALAAQAIADVCTPGNPRDVTEAEIVELYKKVL